MKLSSFRLHTSSDTYQPKNPQILSPEQQQKHSVLLQVYKTTKLPKSTNEIGFENELLKIKIGPSCSPQTLVNELTVKSTRL